MGIFRKQKIISRRETNQMAVKTTFLALFLISCDKVPSDVQIPSQNQTEENDKTETPKDSNPGDTPDQGSSPPGQDGAVSDHIKAVKLSDTNCIDPQLSELKKGIKIMLCDGSLAEGTFESPLLPDLTSLIPENIKAGVTINGITGTLAAVSFFNDCNGNGQTGCIANSTYRSADLSNLSAANVKLGVVIAGVTGSVVSESHSDCSANNQTGCVATTTYRSADLSNLLAQNIKSGVAIAGVSGSVVEEGHSNCSANAQTGCIATASFKAADLTNLQASNIKATVMIAGVTGSLAMEAHSDCSANSEVGCVTTATYKAADLSNLSAGNLKSGVSIAGVTGNYPSATSPLSGATATADLDLATFNAKVKSASDFEWFDAYGNRYVNAGDADLTAANLVKDVSVFGTVGTTEALGTVDSWDIRKGVTVGSVTGTMNPNCRDISEGGPAAEKCYGSSFVDASVAGFPCYAGNKSNCIFKDRITGLRWSKQFDTTQTYANAVNTCSTLNINGVTGWRLPEFTELAVARTNGLTNSLSPSAILMGTWTGSNWTSSAHMNMDTRWTMFMNELQSYRAGNVLETTSMGFFCVK